MAADLLIQTHATAEHLITAGLRNTWAVIIDQQTKTLRLLRDTQTHCAVGPLASVIQQIAQQLEKILSVPGG